MLWMTQIPHGAQQNGASDYWGASDPSLIHFLLLPHTEGNKSFALLWSLLGTTQRSKQVKTKSLEQIKKKKKSKTKPLRNIVKKITQDFKCHLQI